MSSKSKPKLTKVQQAQQSKKKPVSSLGKFKFNFYWIGLAVIIIAVFVIRLRLIDIPLERDEGEYAYIGKQILEGHAPYINAYNMKLPGTYAMYALLMAIFGQNISGIHLGLLFMTIGTLIFLFLGIKKLFNPGIALYTSGVFGIMAISNVFLGFAAHATHFVAFFAAIALYFLSVFYENKKFVFAFLTGLMFGLSFLMKQQAVFFILFGGLAVILPFVLERPLKFIKAILPGLAYSGGVILPYGITVLLLKLAGAFDKFWFWTVEYASKYASGVSFKDGQNLFSMSFKPMWREFKFFWILFFAGIVILFLTKLTAKQKILAFLFALFAFLSICPGFYFRSHYFISFLPAVALLGGITLHYFASLIQQYLKINLLLLLPFAAAFFISVSALQKNRGYYFQAEPDVINRGVYGNNPFVESPQIADYIKANTKETDKVAILGSEPQILFYADRQSATGYIYTYGLMEIHSYNLKMQEEMIAEIEKSKPEIFVFCNIAFSWLARPESPKKIFEWSNQYLQQNYELVGLSDYVDNGITTYKWGNDAKTYKPLGKNNLFVYKRKPV